MRAPTSIVVRNSDSYIKPLRHKVLAELRDIDRGVAIDCRWTTTPLDPRQRGQVVVFPCDTPVRLDVPYPDGATVSVAVGGVEVATQTIRVVDLLIVGMGDSFASGEGNPDVPVRFSKERAVDYVTGSSLNYLGGLPARIGTWQQIGDNEFVKHNARWVDQACHRSLYSHQLRVALQLAIEDPHRAVTFVGVACSGAEVTFGLFLRYKGHEWVPNPPELSQISAVANAQCGKANAKSYDLPEAYHMRDQIPDLHGGLVLRKCDVEKARKIDLLLLSIGGNDIGFARLLANAVLSDKSLLKKLGGWFGQVHDEAGAGPQLETLDERYKAFNRAAHNLLHIPWEESDRIVLTAYPHIALLADGQSICPDGRAGMTILPDFNLSQSKAKEGVSIANRLHGVMVGSAERFGWTFASEHRDRFIGRGICAGYANHALTLADDLRLPRKVEGRWEPFNPADWRPYAMRQRWFRTPNDAFMTGNFHVSQSILQKVMKLKSFAWFQILLASTYSGAFHPTAEGQAAIGDAVLREARQVIAKYQGARRQR